MKKICILTSVHSAFDIRIFHKEAKALVRAGYDVTLIAQHNKNEVLDGVKITALPRTPNRFQRMIRTAFHILKLALKEKVSVYHFHDPELLLIAVFLKLFTGKWLIYDVHENVKKQILSKFWLPIVVRKPISIIYQTVERICLVFIDVIIIAEDSYIENYNCYNNVIAIRNYPVLSYVPNQNVKNQNDEIFHLIYVGEITKLRGIMESLNALFSLKSHGYHNVELNLVGSISPESLRQEILQFIINKGLTEHVHLVAQISHEKIYSFLANSNVGLSILHPYPNYVESLPTKLFEYMAIGLPVIASNFPLWREIVEGNNCGVTVNPLNPEEIAEAIEYLLKNPKLCQKMGENGRKAVLEKYNWEKESKKLLKTYEGLYKK